MEPSQEKSCRNNHHVDYRIGLTGPDMDDSCRADLMFTSRFFNLKRNQYRESIPTIHMESPNLLNRPLAGRHYGIKIGKILSLSLWLALSIGCTDRPIHKLQGFAQGTSYHISFWSETPLNKEEVKGAVESEFERIDLLLSNYRPDSVIEKFNQANDNESLEVGSEIVSLVRIAAAVNKASQGCYDLTIKPLFDLWKFNTDKPQIPDQAAIRQTLNLIGMDKLEVIDDSHLRKKQSGLKVDVSSIAQGYSVESISRILEQKGIRHYLVEIGGELKTRGHKPDMQPWRIAVEKPLPGEQMLQKVMTMPKESPLAIMTSGTYRHYFDDSGKRYSHILDARTGYPVTHDLVSVTVAHADPIQADAWSTALLCLGRQEGLQAANAHNIPALFIEHKNNQLVESRSDPLNALTVLTIE
jgi:thiamine biosynthesis lipoprotein